MSDVATMQLHDAKLGGREICALSDGAGRSLAHRRLRSAPIAALRLRGALAKLCARPARTPLRGRFYLTASNSETVRNELSARMPLLAVAHLSRIYRAPVADLAR